MKKQETNKLFFSKNSLVELNREELKGIKGGTGVLVGNTLSCTLCVNSSKGHYMDEMYSMAIPE